MTALETGVALTIETGRIPIILADDGGGQPARWIASRRQALHDAIEVQGAALVRGLGVRDLSTATDAISAFNYPLMVEREAFAPRVQYPPVYSASQWPANGQMCMHHELSYALECPGRMIFCCLNAADEGGATPIADAAAVLAALPSDVVARFERDGWQLLRNYSDAMGQSWEGAFGTADRSAVERYCRDNGIDMVWDGPRLRTRRKRPAVFRHPRSGQRLWFNQIAFLSEWTLDPDVREYLVSDPDIGPEWLPFRTLDGDGRVVEQEVVDAINDVYAMHAVSEPWKSGDILVLDNIRMAHARDPYRGRREMIVGFANPVQMAE